MRVALEDSAAFGHVAERFRRAGELQRAVSLCRDGLRKFPEHVSARVTLGLALLDLGRHEEAQAELHDVLKRAPDNLAAIRGLAHLHDHVDVLSARMPDAPVPQLPQPPPLLEPAIVELEAPPAMAVPMETLAVEMPPIEMPPVEMSPVEMSPVEIPVVEIPPVARLPVRLELDVLDSIPLRFEPMESDLESVPEVGALEQFLHQVMNRRMLST